MGNPNSSDDAAEDPATAAERRLRGADLDGSEKKRAADHDAYAKRRNPDTELNLDEKPDSLYDDGLDLDDDESETLAGTRGSSSGIKP
jgi:hypothetical protein